MTRKEILRIFDANLNRSREGLRVCEDIARFVLENPRFTRAIKKSRHAISHCLNISGISPSELVRSRDARRDVGRKPAAFENARRSAADVFAANIERAKEALRVLEEVAKLSLGPRLAEKFGRIRYEVYSLEKRIVPHVEALRDYGPQRVGRARVARRGPSSRGGRRFRRAATR